MWKTIILTGIFMQALLAQTSFKNINSEIKKGNFTKAEQLINEKLKTKISKEDSISLVNQADIMHRIRIDFKRTKEEVKEKLKPYFPDLTDKMMDKWEKEKSLEVMVIDGEKRYFNNAVPNLFRINKEAKKIKEAKDGSLQKDYVDFLKGYLPDVVNKIKTAQHIKPLNIRLNYTVTLDKDAVPAGETVRCWLPYPKEGDLRQTDVKMLSVNDEDYKIADNNSPHRTIYLEKQTEAGKPLEFNVQYEFNTTPMWFNLFPEDAKQYDKNSPLYKEFTKEVEPHIVFTKEIKRLAKEIVGNETNPLLKVKKIMKWISSNIPWASAREYSTVSNIPAYCLENKHGDCGMHSLLFITLARYSGIPAKWESGWMLHPGSVNLHDWAEVYYEGYGWAPVDPSFGVQPSDNPDVEYFYSKGIDAFRFIVNEDIAQPLVPAKEHLRSETYDFQRGELEWKGGNIYFDKWDYHMDVFINGEKVN